MNIPNTLTFFRIGMIPCFALVFYLGTAWAPLAAAIIFGLAALTDWLDGYLARRLGQTSKLGAFLDPVADKLMVAVVLIILLQADPTIWFAIPIAIIIGREITVSALREWMAELGVRGKVAVSYIGKVKTFAQMTSMALLILQHASMFASLRMPGFILLYVAAILTLWSMLQYLRAAWPDLREA